MGDPSEPKAIAAALRWLEAVLLGSVAYTIAIIAVASIGLLLLAGRVDVRRAIQVVFGCFIVFGASTIASGIMGVLGSDGASSGNAVPPPTPVTTVAPPTPASALPGTYDPYAGAAVPPR